MTVEKNRYLQMIGAKAQVARRSEPVLEPGRDNFGDNLGDSGLTRNSKPVVYLGFSPR